MQILSEIIEISDEIVNTLDSTDFFESNPFIEKIDLKRNLQIAMQRKWEQQNEMILSDSEFHSVCNDTVMDSIGESLSELVKKGAIKMSVDSDGEILYSINSEFNKDDL